jgi:hypothetical protein|tara:strand:- start:158 stop:322 length:165 start_codon:yes stop_codon:yes gene_type:complete
VGSNREEPLTLVRETGVGRSDHPVLEIEPQVGHLPEHSESGTAVVVAEEVADIL